MKTLPLASLVLSAAVAGVVAQDPSLQQLLMDANTAKERIDILKDDTDFVFNFNTAKATQGGGGKTIGSNFGNFPALFGAGLAMTLGFMDACSINSPHTHPRATELLLTLNGTLQSGFFAENGVRFVVNTIEPYEVAVFPQGSIHFQANLGCKPVFFVATLNNEDPGTMQIAQNFFGLPGEIVGAALGGLGAQEVAELAKYIPDNLIKASQDCFTQCNLAPPAKGSQPTSQQRTPVPLPTSSPSSGATNVADGPSNDNNPTDNDQTTPKANTFAAEFDAATKDVKGWFQNMDGTKIALLTLAALNVAAVVGALIFLCVRSAKKRKLAKQGGFETMTTSTSRTISAPRPLLAGSSSSRGKYEAAQYELPVEDHSSTADLVPRRYDDPYDRPPSRARSPLMQGQHEQYRD